MNGTQSANLQDALDVSGGHGTRPDKMALVECPCGQKFEVWKSGKGYEEFRQHMRLESQLLTGAQWLAAADRISKSKDRARSAEPF